MYSKNLSQLFRMQIGNSAYSFPFLVLTIKDSKLKNSEGQNIVLLMGRAHKIFCLKHNQVPYTVFVSSVLHLLMIGLSLRHRIIYMYFCGPYIQLSVSMVHFDILRPNVYVNAWQA